MENDSITSEAKIQSQSLIDEIHALGRWYLEISATLLENVIRVHENGGAFYEKLILFDVGTIALTLTFLGQLIAHLPGGHVPRHSFIWFLCPAWILLLVSIQCCVQRIVGMHNLNIILVHQVVTSLANEQIQRIRVLSTRLTSLVGKLVISKEEAQQIHLASHTDDNPQPLGTVLSNINDALVQAADAENARVNDLLKKANESEGKTRTSARIAIIATTVALLLICIFAITSILQV